jgi:hypothetical protein
MEHMRTEFEARCWHGWGAAIALAMLMALFLTLPGTTDVAQAQTGGQAASDTSVVIQDPPPQQTQARKAPSSAGFFAQGRKRVGMYGGAGNTLGQTYLILGGGFGYFVLDGLEIGASVEGWLLQSPTIWRLTPEVRYTVWQLKRLSPFAGAFYRWNFVGDPFEDVNSYGGRLGLLYRSGKGFAGVAAVYEHFIDDLGDDSGIWYPEVSFSIFF